MIETKDLFIFTTIGFFFPSQFINTFILCIIYEFIVDMYQKDFELNNIQTHFNEYLHLYKQDIKSDQNKLIDLAKNMSSYYVGHYLRNKLPI